MNELYYLILFIPIAITMAGKYFLHSTISWRELACSILISAGLTALLWQAGLAAKTSDIEILNGEIISKQRDTVSCSHSYQCNCVTITNSKGATTRTCSTCYEHLNDYDWNLKTNVGTITINRIDRQGSLEPPRYTAATPGEPVALRHTYTNWIKASETSILNAQGEGFDKGALSRDFSGVAFPEYPDTVYDYHRIERVVTAGPVERLVDSATIRKLNLGLSDMLKAIGPKKQGNIVIVLVAGAEAAIGPSYANALERVWLGGRKNDTVLVIGLDNEASNGLAEIGWAQSFGWSDDPMLYVELRDYVMELGTLDPDALLTVLNTEVNEHFDRIPMERFEYLRSTIEPPLWSVILAVLGGIFAAVGSTFFFHRKEVFGVHPNRLSRFR